MFLNVTVSLMPGAGSKKRKEVLDISLDLNERSWTLANLYCIFMWLCEPSDETEAIFTVTGVTLNACDPHTLLETIVADNILVVTAEFVLTANRRRDTSAFGLWPMADFAYPACGCGSCVGISKLRPYVYLAENLCYESRCLCVGDIEGNRFQSDTLVESPRVIVRRLGNMEGDDAELTLDEYLSSPFKCGV